MLSRKCGQVISDLMNPGDFNIRVTVVKKLTSRFTQKSAVDGAWKETFRDSIGGGIIHDSKTYYNVTCTTEKGYKDFAVTGDKIISEAWKYIVDCDVVRFDLTKMPVDKNNRHSWIVARD